VFKQRVNEQIEQNQQSQLQALEATSPS